MKTKMKANVFYGPEDMRLEEFDIPAVEDDCALLRVCACGICGTDPHIYHGQLDVPKPIILGHEFSGELVKLGKDFPRKDMLGNDISEGDRVVLGTTMNCGTCYYCRFIPHRNNMCTNCDIYGITMGIDRSPSVFGGYAEYVYLLPGSWVFKLPDTMSYEVGALADPFACATRTVERAFGPGMPGSGDSMGVGSSVVVQGLGSIGLLAAATAKEAGAYPVIGIESVPIRKDLAKEFGVDILIDLSETTVAERVEMVRQLTAGLGADVVLEMAGVPSAFGESLQLVRAGGKVVEFGHFSNVGTVDINPQLIVNKDLDIHGVFAYPNAQIARSLHMLENTADRFPYEKLITHRFSIEEANEAILASRDKLCVKAMLVGNC
jgi:L-iditol 2-dehydrogenase